MKEIKFTSRGSRGPENLYILVERKNYFELIYGFTHFHRDLYFSQNEQEETKSVICFGGRFDFPQEDFKKQGYWIEFSGISSQFEGPSSKSQIEEIFPDAIIHPEDFSFQSYYVPVSKEVYKKFEETFNNS